ncbi:unnamed protein product (macronuclear) [Paramecium tetraurelia]|uniref:Uncharacterized protein n=1 Tax=Paramecium tetraurelia TaxID=5888 RepID=A0CUX1_PARTE|nr:uncharacterized protein GSPATT00010756001 [Paramecium tetraurelia]CAK74588.1 unnamed protein product [Paramecium tetraurelia]|eukprot:XP_001441985.1 hypothetical protein (macronuclear) [Paramecium tetraurelia strain d4-2]
MNSVQHDTIKANLDYDEQTIKELKAHFTAIIDVERKRYNVYNELCKTLEQMQKEREKIFKLKEIYMELSKAFLNVIQKLKKDDDPSDFGFLKLVEKRIIPSLNGHLEQIKQVRQNLQQYILKNTLENEWNEKRAIAKSKNDEKLQKIERTHDEAKRDKHFATSTLSQNYQTYVNDKNSEMKSMFKHFLNGLLDICATGLTEYAKVAQKIHYTSEKKETEELIAKMLGNQKQKK